jgi:hypothetical protein
VRSRRTPQHLQDPPVRIGTTGRLAAERAKVDGVDVDQVKKGLSVIRSAIRKEAAMRREVRTITKATANIEGELRDLRQEVEEGTGIIDAALRARP